MILNNRNNLVFTIAKMFYMSGSVSSKFVFLSLFWVLCFVLEI